MTTYDIPALAQDVYDAIVADVDDPNGLYYTDRPDPDYDFMLRSFSELHDFCDANTYLIDALGEDAQMSTDEDMKVWNDLADAVDALLKAKPLMLLEARNA